METNKILIKLVEALNEPKEQRIILVNEILEEGRLLANRTSSDVLGFSKKNPSVKRQMNMKIFTNWLENQYTRGWSYVGKLEAEVLPHGGFVVMERNGEKIRELLNKINPIVVTAEPESTPFKDIGTITLDIEPKNSLEQMFEEETGKNAVYRGRQTIAFKNWKSKREEEGS